MTALGFRSLTLRLKRGMSMESYWARRVVLDDELSGGEDSRPAGLYFVFYPAED